MSDQMMKYLYIVSAAIGVLFLLYIVMRMKMQMVKKLCEKEIDGYKKMLLHKMEVESTGLETLRLECESLKKQNENLRISLQAYSQKPGRKELQRLNIYQTALDNLLMNTPGFGTAWQMALQQSEEDFAKTDKGILPFIKRLIPMKVNASEMSDEKANIDDENEPS